MVKNDEYFAEKILIDLKVVYLTLSEDVPRLIKELEKI